jgi:hypothetical protein
MLESITIVTISLILLAYFRPGKTPPLEKPLLIERAGKYQMLLAAKLNLAQPFLEQVAERIRPLFVGIEGSAVQYFVVRDEQARAHGTDIYLLAICCRNQMLYFYVANPKPSQPNEYLDAIKAYSINCMDGFSVSNSHREELESIIFNSTIAAAAERGIEVIQLTV